MFLYMQLFFTDLNILFLYMFFSLCGPSTQLYWVVALCETMNLERKYSYPHPLFHPPQCFSPKTNGKHVMPQNQVLRLRSAEVKPLDESGPKRICNCLYHEKGATKWKIKPLLFWFHFCYIDGKVHESLCKHNGQMQKKKKCRPTVTVQLLYKMYYSK